MGKRRVYGIDLGTTYSCIAYVDEHGKAVTVPNAEGEPTTPSVVYFEDGYGFVVGQAAKEIVAIHPDRSVSFVKLAMGDPHWEREIAGRRYHPEDIASFILRKVISDAEKVTGDKIEDVAITCPAYFGAAEKEATLRAGILAGLNVTYLLPEPWAAALAYSVGWKRDETLLVYDLGGASFDVTLLNNEAGEMKILSIGGERYLGGRDWDDAIVSHLALRFEQETGTAADALLEDQETYQDLLNAAERSKKVLSSRQTTWVPVRFRGERVRVDITRETFDHITSQYLNRTLLIAEHGLEKAREQGYKTIDKLLLVGGSTYMPQVIAAVKSHFSFEMLQLEPDQAIARGAALFAANSRMNKPNSEQAEEAANISSFKIIEDSLSHRGLVNAAAKSFGIVLPDRRNRVRNLILKGDLLPSSHTLELENLQDGRLSIDLQCMENVHRAFEVDVSDCKALGEAILPFTHPLPKGYRFEVEFELEPNGLLTVKGRDRSGGEITANFQTDAVTSTDYFGHSRQAPPERASRTQRSQIFISYSHKDKAWLDRLKSMLKPALRDQKIVLWEDSRIATGAKWREEIDRAIASAQIAVLLVSQHFLDSDFIHENELLPLLRLAERDGLKIVWVCLSHCLYDKTDIQNIQAAHDPRRPVAEFRRRVDQDKVLAQICRQIVELAQEHP